MVEGNIKQLIRILNTDLDGSKKIGFAITKIHGVGINFANSVCNIAGIDKSKRTGDVTLEEKKKIEDIITNPVKYKFPVWMLNRRKDKETGEDVHLISANLDFRKDFDIKDLKKIKSYRGIRHAMGQPTRGQRTKAHFRHGKSLGVHRSKLAPAKSSKKE